MIRLHRAIATDAPSWRFCRGLLIGFVAGCVLMSTAFRAKPQEPVHTIVEPARFVVAALR